MEKILHVVVSDNVAKQFDQNFWDMWSSCMHGNLQLADGMNSNCKLDRHLQHVGDTDS